MTREEVEKVIQEIIETGSMKMRVTFKRWASRNLVPLLEVADQGIVKLNNSKDELMAIVNKADWGTEDRRTITVIILKNPERVMIWLASKADSFSEMEVVPA